MFHPANKPMKRGWVGRIDGDHVIQLAAQTLQAFFTGGGAAREHAVYPLDGVRLLAPVLHPPAVRVFEDEYSFEFANPAAIVDPGSEVLHAGSPSDKLSQSLLEVHPRVAAVVGAGNEIGGFTMFAEWRDSRVGPPKDRDFALGLGPVVVTSDELDPNDLEATVQVDGETRLHTRLAAFDWTVARDLAGAGTMLRPGDVLAGPAAGVVDGIAPGSAVELVVEGIGVLGHTLLRD